ncbi:hypothetical protein WG66_013267, partial [Moniliophthora roreri]
MERCLNSVHVSFQAQNHRIPGTSSYQVLFFFTAEMARSGGHSGGATDSG